MAKGDLYPGFGIQTPSHKITEVHIGKRYYRLCLIPLFYSQALLKYLEEKQELYSYLQTSGLELLTFDQAAADLTPLKKKSLRHCLFETL